MPGRFHFFRGSDPGRWARNARSFERVKYDGLYPGVAVEFLVNDGGFEYDLVLSPGAELGAVAVRCEGADGLRVEPDGSLVLASATGFLRQQAPLAWIGSGAGLQVPVRCSFVELGNDRYGFKIGDGDNRQSLVIDPGLEWSTYLGGTFYSGPLPAQPDDVGVVVVDHDGTVLVVGTAGQNDFPTTAGAYKTSKTGQTDAYVTRFDPSGISLVFSTFLGGSSVDVGDAIALTTGGSIMVAGWTGSADFPLTPGAIDTVKDVTDGFVVRLSPSGDAVEFGTFLGGTSLEVPRDLTVGASETVTVTGYTLGPNFPVTPGAFDTTFSGAGGQGQDGFVPGSAVTALRCCTRPISALRSAIRPTRSPRTPVVPLPSPDARNPPTSQ